MSIKVKGVSKRFGAFTAVDNVDLDLESGDLVALLGPSGSGKSTLLRIIAGLEAADEGEVLLTGREATTLAPKDRNVGFVFQHYALFKHMTVADNIGFGLRARKRPEAEVKARVEELLNLVQMQGFGTRFPSQLSGGQRQRVAVARALAPEPQVLLLDEPFGALDAKVRVELRQWVRRVHDATGMTTLFVTHDQEEAMEVANRVVIMNHGKIVQQDSPQRIFDHPATQFVADFVGESNRLEIEAVEDGLAVWGPLRFKADKARKGQPLRIYFRPHDVYVTRAPEAEQVPATILAERFKGAFTEMDLDLGGGKRLLAQLPRGLSEESGFTVDDRVWVSVAAYHVFDNGGEGQKGLRSVAAGEESYSI